MNSIIKAASRLALRQVRNRCIMLTLPAASQRLINNCQAIDVNRRWLSNAQSLQEVEKPTNIPTNLGRDRIIGLERYFARFEDRCQKVERVGEKDFIKTFDLLTKSYERLEKDNQLTDDIKVNISLLSAVLLRCCGKLMAESDFKTRELLAGNLWHFMKEKKLPLDISHYNSLLRALNENQTNYDPEKILDEVKGAGLSPDRVTYQRLIHQYCLQGDIAKATSLLEKMKDQNMELNELTFASLILGYSKQETPPSMTEMFELMKSNGVEPTSRSYAAAIIAQIQLMGKDQAKAEQEMSVVLELMQKDECYFSIYEAIDILSSPNLDIHNETVNSIVDFICKTPYNFNGRYRLHNTLLEIGLYKKVSELYWEQEPSENTRRNHNVGSYYIKLLASHKNIPVEHAVKECTLLQDKNYNTKSFYTLYYSAAEVGNLPVVRAALKKISEEEPIKCHYLWPLIVQSKTEDELVETLKNDIHSKLNTQDLMETFTQWVWPKFSDNVNRLFELNKKVLNFDNNLLMASYLSYSVQENKIMDAIKFVTEAPLEQDNNQDTNNDDNLGEVDSVSSQSRSRGALLGRLLLQIAEQTKDPAIVSKAFNLCKLPGQPIASSSLAALVKVHILNEEFDKALEEFLKIAKEYKITPCKPELTIYCLEKKDSENLQKIMDVSNEIYGETNSLFDLAICCLRLGKLKQAQKIFNSPNFRVNPSRIYSAVKQNAAAGNIGMLENLIQLTRDMYDINQEILYQILIDAYERTSNAKRVLDLWNRMQEEEFQPSKRSLVMIANVLERNGIEVPFQKPKMDSRNLNGEGDSLGFDRR